MRLAFVALLGTTILLGACGGGGGSRPATGSSGTHTVPFDPDDAPQTPPPVSDPDGQPFTHRILFEWYGTETTPQQLVARNEAEYKAITDRCSFQYGDWGDPPPGWVPPVDFDTEIVVAVFLGTVSRREKPGIEGISRAGDGALVRWVHYDYAPHPNAPPDNTPVRPYVLAAMTRVEGAVTFTGRTEVVPYQ